MSNPHVTLIGRIIERLESDRERIAVTLLLSGGERSLTLTRGELSAAVRAQAAHLREAGAGAEEGSTVIVLADHGAELIVSFLAAMFVGAVPTIYAPPSPKMPVDRYRQMLVTLAAASKATHVITDRPGDLPFRQLMGVLPDLRVIDAACSRGAASAMSIRSGGDLALLQYSSGTTGLRKGVALSNRAVLAQLDRHAQRLGIRDDDVIVSWLPLYHDMGLIACFLLPLVCGVPFVMMSPFDWLARPARFFEALTRERGTLAWLPNFAFNLLATRVEPAGFDLRHVRGIVNCSEPVRADSHDAFIDRFAKVGLRSDAVWTCYAMAETTFAITQGGAGEPVRVEALDAAAYARGQAETVGPSVSVPRRMAVSSGRPITGSQVRIVDAARAALGERSVGEIAVRSDSLFDGYLGQPQLTRDVLADGWYYTGDLGYLADGHLFVTGRKKDLIIVAGKNVHAEDVEEIATHVPGVHPGRVAAFGVPNDRLGTEDVVVVAESAIEDAAARSQLALAIATAVREQLDCIANDVRIVSRGTLAKSSSGKIARATNRDIYMERWRPDVLL